MGREKRDLPAAVLGGPKQRHRRAQVLQEDPKAPPPLSLVAKQAVPKSKHYSYFEFVENKDKKKRLDFQIVHKKTPPPGFEFIPIGNPLLSSECKELSREKDYMIFIVSDVNFPSFNDISQQTHRIGHHFRQTIVEEARAKLSELSDLTPTSSDGESESIPKSQAEYNAKVDAALRDLFPRIPNTDRQAILDHSFSFRLHPKAKQRVGLNAGLSLARRVQLAALAHIRHTHTRYDELLKETSWAGARKVVEPVCLDILVKWRGDEETGRDQLDEILREVVVISDSESEGSDGEETDDSSVDGVEITASRPTIPGLQNYSGTSHSQVSLLPSAFSRDPQASTPASSHVLAKRIQRAGAVHKRDQRGFKRYRAAWEEAIQRNRAHESPQFDMTGPIGDSVEAMELSPNQGQYQTRTDRESPKAHPAITLEETSASSRGDPHVGSRVVFTGSGQSASGHPAHGPLSVETRPVGPSRHYLPGPPVPYAAPMVISDSYEGRPVDLPLSGQGSSPLDRLQDYLVPSIEPTSPDAMRPSFVRAVPPRNYLPMDHSVAWPSGQPQVRAHSPMRDEVMTDFQPSFGRRVISENASYHGVFPTQRPSQILDIAREPDYLRPFQNRSDSHRSSFLPHPRVQNLETEQSSAMPVTQRIVVDAPRPGERSNPILMEDRGGFYERVAAPSREPVLPPDEMTDLQQPAYAGRHVAQPSHRVVSWQEGSRILRESRDWDGVEIVPISGPTTHQSGTRGRHVSVGPFPMRRDSPYSSAPGRPFGAPTRFPYPDDWNPEVRPVLEFERASSLSQPYWQGRPEPPMPESQQYYQPVYRHFRDEHHA